MNVGIIGLGRMGKNHLRVLASIRSNINEISIYDCNTDEMIKLSKIFGVKYYDNLEDFFNGVDSVIICTPTTSHYEIASKCIEKNKNILLEKPITSTTEEAQALIKSLEGKSLICMVGHIERFNPAILYLCNYLKNKKILSIYANRISMLELGRNFDVDVVTDLMIHDIDVILSIVESKPYKIWGATNDKTLNSVSAMIQYENGVVANLTASRTTQEKIRKLDIITDDENIHVDYIKNKIDIIKLCNVEEQRDNNSYSIVARKKSIYFEGEPLKIELLHFLECAKKGVKPMSNEITGQLALSISRQIVESIIENEVLI